MALDLSQYGITVTDVRRNLTPPILYQDALRMEKDSVIASSGALIAYSVEKTGRSPRDKRVVRHPASENDVWWGPVNIQIPEATFGVNRERATDYLNTRRLLYVVDAFAGWDLDYRDESPHHLHAAVSRAVHVHDADSPHKRRTPGIRRTGRRHL